jgi:hypothetical protein
MSIPCEVVFAPDWWHHHHGISFDHGFFFDPRRRVADERCMEAALRDRFGRWGLGAHADEDRPEVGPVHLATGWLASAMLGCQVEFASDRPPLVHPAGREDLDIDPDAAFASPAFREFASMVEQLQTTHGRVTGDINWSGVLNVALDLRGQDLFADFMDRPEETAVGLARIAQVLERLADWVEVRTGSSSVSVNRLVRHLPGAVRLHSCCSLTMISVPSWRRYLAPIEATWAGAHPSYGIHYCGADPHRFAPAFAALPKLDVLDVGWGGEVATVRRHLPDTFLSLRLSPAVLVGQDAAAIAADARRLVAAAGGDRCGLCCINLDRNVSDAQVDALFAAAQADVGTP